jgi:hypothetical protein
MASLAIMRATLLLRERIDYPDGALIEMKIWQVPMPVPPTTHGLKYSLVYIVLGQRAVGYDNERGKGDHRHLGLIEMPYHFISAARLIEDFRADVVAVRGSI